MKRLFSAKSLLVAAVALGAVGAASARTDVVLSLGVNAPYGYVQSAPVYVEPQPVYVQPRAVYVEPQTVYYRGDWRREELRREEWRRAEFRRHHGWEHSAYADYDHDGVPNRYDRAPYNPYRR
jgi:hypothetical protein